MATTKKESSVMFTKTYSKYLRKHGDSKRQANSHNKYSVISVSQLSKQVRQVSQVSLTKLLQKLEIVAEILFLPVMVGLALLFMIFGTAIWG